jgi:hypothetical protein
MRLTTLAGAQLLFQHARQDPTGGVGPAAGALEHGQPDWPLGMGSWPANPRESAVSGAYGLFGTSSVLLAGGSEL